MEEAQLVRLLNEFFSPPPTAVKYPPVVWAIDAFTDDMDLQVKTATALQSVFPESVIHPVYVLSEDAFLDRGYANFLRPALKPMAFKAALRVISETHVVNLKKPRILTERQNSKAASAKRLMRYARKIGASTIAVGAHGRSGIGQLFSTHFTDQLLRAGDVPVLIAGPRMGWPHIETRPETVSGVKPIARRTIVFPTDFSPACEATFERLLGIAARTKADLHVLYDEACEVQPSSSAGGALDFASAGLLAYGAGWTSIDPGAMAQAQVTLIRQESRLDRERWSKRAHDAAVPIHFIVQNSPGPLSTSVVDYVSTLRETSVLLATVSTNSADEMGLANAGPITNLFGDTTKALIRQCPCPVLIATRYH